MKMNDTRTYAMMAKPIGAACNLKCTYCYYLEKTKLMGQKTGLMSDEILEAFTKQNLIMHGKDAVVEFAWHGGEPTIAQLDFYKRALMFQKRFGAGRKIRNTLQTNGTLLNDAWCEFFAANGFLIGVSIDGDSAFHDCYRQDKKGGTFSRTMDGIGLLQKHGVAYNTLTTINAVNVARPKEVYRFLRELTDFIQFLPVVESLPASYEKEYGQRFAMPAGIH